MSAIGIGKAETLASLQGQRTGIGPLRYLQTAHTEFPVGEVKKSNDELKQMLGLTAEPTNRTALLGMLALDEALAEARLSPLSASQASSSPVALVSGTTVGGMDCTEQHYLDYFETDAYNDYIRTHDCGATTELMVRHSPGFTLVTTLSTACSSAANAIVMGANLLCSGKAEIVVVGGAESLTKYHLNGFNSLMILDQEQCRPFDATRAGLNLGEGAAFLVMEKTATARQRGVKGIGVLSGFGNACDAFHQTASSDNGEGAFLAMKQALEKAGLTPAAIGYVNAHGTGTPNNDASESQALLRIFGTALPPVSSTKGFTGHTTSASGAVEAVICLLALQHQFVPVNYGFSQSMPDGITPFSGGGSNGLRHVMCNSFGFGGNDTSLVFSSAGLSDESVELTTRAVANAQFSPLSSRQTRPIWLTAATQISMQQPLSEAWLTDPLTTTEPYVRSQEPNFRDWLSPLESRRMGKLLKRALATALDAIRQSGIAHPEAIITGTGLGCIDSTEHFLEQLSRQGEEMLPPTHFMQSTHNTISSLIAIHTHCHGYNATYSHQGVSFDSALLDAYLQLGLGDLNNALVTANDELTPGFFRIFQRAGLLGQPGQAPATEASVAVMLSTSPEGALCQLEQVQMFHADKMVQPEQLAAQLPHVDGVDTLVLGIGGLPASDAFYTHVAACYPQARCFHYKQLFGEGFSASALGFYAAAHLIRSGQSQRLLFVNQSAGGAAAFVVMSSPSFLPK